MMNKVIPIQSIQVSNDTAGHEAIMLFSGNAETYWKPLQVGNKNNFVQIDFFHPHIVESIDFLFHQTATYDILVDVLKTDNTQRITVGTFTVEGDESYPIRVNIPTTLTKSIRVTFLAYTESTHTYLTPELSEIRVNGVVEADEFEPVSAIDMVPLPCPKGYYKNENGECISERTMNIAELLNDDFNLVKTNKLDITLEKPIDLDEIVFLLTDRTPRIDITVLINIPNKFMQTLYIQKEIDNYSLFLNKTIPNVTRMEMILYSDTHLSFNAIFFGKRNE